MSILIDSKIISAEDILKEVRKLIEFPRPQVCRHYIACDLISLLASKGIDVPTDLIVAVVNADDEAALVALEAVK
jgi:hypothetical protein